MNDEISILNNVDKIQLKSEPFPYIVIKDALPINLAGELTRTFPVRCFNLKEHNNKRLDISASDAMSKDIISLWKKFILFHSSKKFFYQMIDLFGDSIIDIHKDFFNKINDLKGKKIGLRHVDEFKDYDFLMDAQISINTPVYFDNSVRKIHVDRNNKLYSGLFYLRQPHDDSIGGDLQIFKWKSSIPDSYKKDLYREPLDNRFVELVDSIKYENNVAVLFLNSLDSLHGVTVRNKTKNIRTFVNLVCEVPFSLYPIGNEHNSISNRLIRLARKIFFTLKETISINTK